MPFERRYVSDKQVPALTTRHLKIDDFARCHVLGDHGPDLRSAKKKTGQKQPTMVGLTRAINAGSTFLRSTALGSVNARRNTIEHYRF